MNKSKKTIVKKFEKDELPKTTEPKWEDYTACNFTAGGQSKTLNILTTDFPRLAEVLGDFLKEKGIDCIVTTEKRPGE